MKRLLILAMPLVLLASAASAKTVSFSLENDTSSVVTEFYLSSPGVDNWEENLVTSPIQIGEKVSSKITGADSCVFDVKTVFADGTETEDRSFDLCDTPNYKIEDE